MRYPLSIALICLCTAFHAQIPFELDTSFRTQISNHYVGGILALNDGSIIASGLMQFPGESSFKRLVRLLPDGGRDEDFYNSGLGGGKIEPWSDKMYVSAGETVRRILNDGTQDLSFIGMNLGPYFSSSQGGDYHVFPDGRVVMSGSHFLSDSIRGFMGMHQFIWFTNTGHLDTTRIHRKANGPIYRFKELPDGKFICSGLVSSFEGQPVGRIFRLNADGSLDTTFQTNAYWGEAYAYHPLPDGRVYAAGLFTMNGVSDTIRIARFLPNGELDPTFTSPYFGLGSIPDASGWGALLAFIYPDGEDHLILTGNYQVVNGEPRHGLCMIDDTGTLIYTFHQQGVGTYTSQWLTQGSVLGMVPSADGDHYYIWGAYNGYDDGVVNDPQQRFISRLHGGDNGLGTATTQSSGSSLRIHPNPANDMATVQFDLKGKNSVLLLRDALGKLVYTRKADDRFTTLYLNGIGNGIYQVEFINEDERLSVGRLVIQH